MAGAERGPHGQLPFAAHRSREDQVGDVGARDDEDDRRGGEQQEQDRPRGRRDLIAELRDPQLDLPLRRIRLGMLANHRGVHRGQLGPRGLERNPWRETAEELRHPVAAVRDHRRAEVMRARHHVRDDLGVGGIGHRWLEDADHRGGARAKADDPADDGRIAVQCSRPEPVREDRRPRGFRAIVLRVQEAAEHGAKPHHVEERPADDARFDDPGLAAEAEHREINGREVSEGADGGDARFQVADLGHRERHVLGAKAGRALADVDQAIFVAIDQGAQEHAADDTEDRGIGADAERERHHDRGSQALGAAERPQPDPHILPECPGHIEPAVVPHAPHRLPHVRDVAELPQRGQAGGPGILATLDPFLDAEGQMATDFLVEVTLVRPHGLLLARRRGVHDAADRVHEL